MNAPIQVRTFPLPPRGRLIALSIAAVVMLLSTRKEVIAPGSPIYDYLLAGRPNALTHAIQAQNGLFYLLFGVHSVECALFAVLRLHKHGVPFFSSLWWKWTTMCFVGGFSAWKHFDMVLKTSAAKRV
ncbi:hypothetical protein TruAng_005445 [Truncatella angustata]|nr:hypothetical protein TruAng_005445 [Truncatella angustata]